MNCFKDISTENFHYTTSIFLINQEQWNNQSHGMCVYSLRRTKNILALFSIRHLKDMYVIDAVANFVNLNPLNTRLMANRRHCFQSTDNILTSNFSSYLLFARLPLIFIILMPSGKRKL